MTFENEIDGISGSVHGRRGNFPLMRPAEFISYVLFLFHTKRTEKCFCKIICSWKVEELSNCNNSFHRYQYILEMQEMQCWNDMSVTIR